MKMSLCILKGIKNLFSKEILKVVLLFSLPLFFLYLLILFLFWNDLIAVSNLLISWIPFSVLKLNGAFFIMFFSWFICVVISFAFLTGIVSALFIKKIENYYQYYLTFSILFFSLFYAFIFIQNWDYIYGEIQKLITLLPFDTVSKAISGLILIYIFYNLFILTLFSLIFLFNKEFLYAIKEYEYPTISLEISEKIKYKHLILKDIVIFVVLFMLLFPLFFIPVINIGVQLFLWSKLYHDSFLYFICSEFCEAKEFEKLKENKLKTIIITLIAASFNFLPIINFFAPFFVILVFFHCIMQLKTSTNV